MKKPFLLACLASVIVAAPALAQQGDDTIEVWTYSARYLEAMAGMATVTMASDNIETTATGARLGVIAGWGRQFWATEDGIGLAGSFETEVGYSAGEACGSPSYDPNQERCIKTGLDVYGGAKFGANLHDRVIPYIKAGLSSGKVKSAYTNPLYGDPQTSGEFIRIGFGMDYNLGEAQTWIGTPLVHQTYVKLEYRINNFDFHTTGGQLLVGVGRRFP
ncbi:MAG: porin family protein [Gemmatimonadota bacterium]|jgi:hypothetical protein|nr:porin family protein [Gemmatimonadota bacterium]